MVDNPQYYQDPNYIYQTDQTPDYYPPDYSAYPYDNGTYEDQNTYEYQEPYNENADYSGYDPNYQQQYQNETPYVDYYGNTYDPNMQYPVEDQTKKGPNNEKEWYDYTRNEKIKYIVLSIIKFIGFIALLYLFLLSLSFMTVGFTMVTSYTLGWADVIRFLLKNPFAALAIGIIATAIMQNATATTSIAVSMVGAGIIPDVKNAVPIIMGANIGTCVTNSFIALTQAGDPEEFKRAFSAATLNDGFNILTTSVLLPIEIASGMLYEIGNGLTGLISTNDTAAIAQANFIAGIINPVINIFILLNATAVDAVSNGNGNITDVALRCCDDQQNYELKNITFYDNATIAEISKYTDTKGSTQVSDFTNRPIYYNDTVCLKPCTYWCIPMLNAFGDGGTGLFWIILSIIVLIASLFSIVKVIKLLIVGPIAKGVTKAVNASFPGRLEFISEIILFAVSLILTLIVQSSNIITATLVPLCGIGIITIQRVYVMTLGSNIGTTITGILSAFTVPPSALKKSLQLAFVYTFFNTLGVVFWLPIPFLRFPKIYSRVLGDVIFKYKWFLFVYVGFVYFVGPLIIFGLALIPYWIGLAIFGIPFLLIIGSAIILKVLQTKLPRVLPPFLQSFDFLPIWLRSLEPYDSKVKNLRCFRPKEEAVEGYDPQYYQNDAYDQVYAGSASAMFVPNMIRRLSVIESLVTEAKMLKRRNTIENYEIEKVKIDNNIKKSLEEIKKETKITKDISIKDKKDVNAASKNTNNQKE